MNPPRPPSTLPFRLASLALAGLTITACGGGGGGGGGTGPGNTTANSIRGTLSVVAPDAGATLEAEPNDAVDQAHVLGSVGAGQSRTILGSTTDDGSDPFDGFLVVASGLVRFDIALNATNAASDLDVLIADPVTLQFVERFDSPQASEAGSFEARGPFFVVVRSASGASDYELRLSASAAGEPFAEREPNDVSGDGQYLGTLSSGETIAVAGSLGLSDTTDRFVIGFPEAGALNFAAAFDAGNDFDVRVSDVTNDLTSPNVIAAFETTANPEVGSVPVNAMTLIEFEIFRFDGEGTYRVDIANPVPSPANAPVGVVATLSSKARGSLATEASFLRGAVPPAAFSEPRARVLAGQTIVRANAGVQDLSASLARFGARSADRVPGGGPELLEFDLSESLSEGEQARYTIALATSLRGRAGVRYAEPNYMLQPLQTVPNDPFYNLQWHYESIQLPAAWDITTGDNGVIVAVLDTGSTPHPDLVGREIAGFDMISSTQISGDGDGRDPDPFDVGDSTGFQPSSFHGSHVAGTIGAETNNGDGVAGVDWACRIMHLRVLGIGGGSTFDILNGVLYAAGLPNASNQTPPQAADVMNLSLGGPGFSQATQDACLDARNAGTLIIAAAGNENSTQPSYPAAYDGVMSVSALDLNLQRAPYSNRHASVDISAPGGDVSGDRNSDGYADGVLSTKPDDSANPTNYDSYSFYQGTSMAAPHVAGVAALVLAVDPNQTPAQLEALLTSTSTDLGPAGRDDVFGHGMVNAFAAVQAAQGGGSTTPNLSLAESTLLFSSRQDCRRVPVANTGGGTLSVTNLTASEPWLSATAIAVQSGGAADTSAIEICVDGNGLPDGTYSGTVAVNSNGGNAQVRVTLSLGQVGGGVDYTVFILAVDANDLTTLAQRTIQTSGPRTYAFGDLPAGDYFIVAGTDENDDGFICDEGEPLCGIYPSLESASVIQVEGGQTFANADFPLEGAFTTQSTDGPRGFRRLIEGQSQKETR